MREQCKRLTESAGTMFSSKETRTLLKDELQRHLDWELQYARHARPEATPDEIRVALAEFERKLQAAARWESTNEDHTKALAKAIEGLHGRLALSQ
jgi:hypothetical protein